MSVAALDCAILPLTDKASLEARWRDLEERAGASFFLSWDWMGPWLAHVKSPLYLCEVRQGGHDVGLAILGVGRLRYGLLSFQTIYLNQSGNLEEDRGYIEYNGILCAASHRGDVWKAFLDYLANCRRQLPGPLKSWSLVRLAGMQGPFDESAVASRMMVFARETQKAYLIELPDDRDSSVGYLGSLSGNTRQKISRARRLLSQDGDISFEVAKTSQQVDEWLPEMAALQSLWFAAKGQTAALSRPFFNGFVRQLVVDNLASGSVEFILCMGGGSTIGYLINLISEGQVLSYQSAFSQYEDNKIKPGLVCHAMMAGHYMSRTSGRYNLLAGDSQYKVSLSNSTEDLSWLTLALPKPQMRILLWLGRILRR